MGEDKEAIAKGKYENNSGYFFNEEFINVSLLMERIQQRGEH